MIKYNKIDFSEFSLYVSNYDLMHISSLILITLPLDLEMFRLGIKWLVNNICG